ncbi:MAG: hypothetical protein GY932_08955 [Arcobacter sp.]|nr:hypothetical protein [Arcobacter sp.]
MNDIIFYNYNVLTIEHIVFIIFVILTFSMIFIKKLRNFMIFNVKIKKFIFVVIGFEFFIIFFILFEILRLDKIGINLAQVHHNKSQMIGLADELRQSSDDLTHYARTYTITNNSKYKDIYYEILDIRNAKKGRPLFYESIYWDLSKKVREKRHPFKEKKALKDLMLKLPYTQKELDLLGLSEFNSNDLVNLEKKAFKLMPDSQEEAIKILHSEEYYKAKEIIMLPIDDMIMSIYTRTNSEINFLQKKIRNEFILIFFTVAYFIIINILIYFILNKKVGQPIAYLTDVILKFKSGDKDINKRILYDDEIGYMNDQFFFMKDKISDQQDSLNKINKNLEKKVSEKTLELRKFNEQLQVKIYERTQELEESNYELQTMIENLKKTQDKLIEAEKMASLGTLVAGVAHEINTPIGVSLTAATYLINLNKNIKENYHNQNLSEDEFNNYLENSNKTNNQIITNLQRTANLVKSFKQISVNQCHEEKRNFELISYLKETLLSLDPIIKKTKIEIVIEHDTEILLNSFAGAYSQIFTNLIINSIKHGFKNIEKGTITINIIKTNNEIKISFKDTGKGIPSQNIKKIFDPFFTTNRKDGGTGLGLNIIYNIITNKLNGKIECFSEENIGTEFIIHLPYKK